MDNTLIAAIIGGICTILSPLIVLLIQNKNSTKHYIAIDKERKNTANGSWTGKVRYEQGSELENHDIYFEITTNRKILKGYCTYTSKNGTTKLIIKGGFYSDRFLKIEHINEKIQIIHFGYTLLELDASARKLTGKFITFGRIKNKIISGFIGLEKNIQ